MTDVSPNCRQASPHRIFLVDDHPVTRAGLTHLLQSEPDLEVCGQAGSPSKAVAGIATAKPELAIIEISLAGGTCGLELIKDLAARFSRLRMLAFSTSEEFLYAERALRAGARGYLMKQEPTESVIAAIRSVLKGDIYLSPAMKDRLLRKVVKPDAVPLGSEVEQLSDRELEVYRLLGQGRGTRQIAATLHLSISTVENHRAHIKDKLNLGSSPELVQHAIEWLRSQPP